MDELLEALSREAERRGVTPSTLVAGAGVSPAHYYRWRRGLSKPRLSTIKRLAASLQIPVKSLLGDASIDGEDINEVSASSEGNAGAASTQSMRFFGLTDAAFNELAPLLAAMERDAVEVPASMSAALRRVAVPFSNLSKSHSQSSTSPATLMSPALIFR